MKTQQTCPRCKQDQPAAVAGLTILGRLIADVHCKCGHRFALTLDDGRGRKSISEHAALLRLNREVA